MDVALAYHCQNQDMILKDILESLGSYSWEDVKRFGIPLWLKDLKKLGDIIESVAKTEYQRSKYARGFEPCGREKDVEKLGAVSVWYILLKKKTVLASLYRNNGGDQGRKIFDFLGHNFAEDRWKKAAVRNAYQLFSQKKYVLAASFYILGGQINEATQVAIAHLKDLHLAVAICRMTEGEGAEELKKIYTEYYVGKGVMYNDPWLTMLGHWLCGEYVKSLNCISDEQTGEPKIKDELDPRHNVFCREESARRRNLTEEWSFESPSLSTFNASIIVLCKKLEKHYLVFGLLDRIGDNVAQAGGEFAAARFSRELHLRRLH